MEDSLFEMLMNFFEKNLPQSKENNASETSNDELVEEDVSEQLFYIRPASAKAIRLFTAEERNKLTKASYQFLTKLMLWQVLSIETVEEIMNQLLSSDSYFVSLQEMKWAIRDTLAEDLTPSQLAFLELVLYQQEDNQCKH